MSVKNPETANELSDTLDEQRGEAIATLAEHDATRRKLESDGGGQTRDALAAVEGGSGAEAVPDDAPGYTMSVERRIGTTHMTVTHYDGDGTDHETRMGFGRPNGRASRDIFAPIDEAEMDEDQSVGEMTDYIWGTLSEWCLETEPPSEEAPVAPTDPDFWATRMGLGGAINVLQELALGGIGPNE